MPSRRSALPFARICLGLWLLFSPATLLGQDKALQVLVLASAGKRRAQGFEQALQIQFSDQANVRPAFGLASGPLALRVDSAIQTVRREKADVGLWLEPSGQRGEWLLYVVAARSGRVLVEVMNVPGEGGPEEERGLAIKTHEVLESSVMREKDSSSLTLEPKAPAKPKSEPAPCPPPPKVAKAKAPEPPSPVQVALEAGLLLASKGGSLDLQYGLFANGRLDYRIREHGYVAGSLGLRMPSRLKAEEAGVGRVTIGEWTPFLSAHGGYRAGRLHLGAFAGLLVRVFRSEGITAGETVGSSTDAAPFLSLGAEGRFDLSKRLWLRAAVGPEIALRRQRFSLNDIAVADTGFIRVAGTLSLAVAL